MSVCIHFYDFVTGGRKKGAITVKKIKCIWLLVFILIFLTALSLYAMANEKDDEKKYSPEGAKIELFVSLNKNTTAGLSVSYFDDNEILYRNHFGYMDVENKIPVTDKTVMDWGSVSKLLIWVSVMQLVEEKKIDLAVDINTYLPHGFLTNIKYDKEITMINLMNHNAGFEESIIGMACSDEDDLLSLEAYLQAIQPAQIFEPGTVCAYSNWGTTLAAYIVERVSGMYFSEYVRKNIFEPLEMNDTAFSADLSDNEDVKQRRLALKTYTTDVTEITPNISYSSMYPAGMCVSTIADMEKFAQALLSEDMKLFKKKETYEELFTPTLLYEGTNKPRNCHGFWVVEGYGAELIGHNGLTSGCSSNLLLDLKNKKGIIITTNQKDEQIYRFQMLGRIFGGSGVSTEKYSGLVMDARTVFTGPLKIYSLFCISDVEQGNAPALFIKRTTEGGIDRFECPYGDYIVIDKSDVTVDIVILILYGISVLYSLINIIIFAIKKIVCLIKHKKEDKLLRIWCVISCVLQLVPLVVFGLIIPTLLSTQQWPIIVYKILFFAIFLAMVAMMALVVFGFVKMKKIAMRKMRRIYIMTISFSMILAIISIIYWEWGMFLNC